MPQTPAKLSVKISGKNTTVTLLNEGEINFLKYPGLTEITLPLVFPMLTASKRPDYYLTLLERAKTQRTTTQFIMTRTTPAGQLLFDTNIKVSVEDYTIEENATNGLDVSVEVKLKQYRDYSTKTVAIKTTVKHNDSKGTPVVKKTATVKTTRPATTAPKVLQYQRYGTRLKKVILFGALPRNITETEQNTRQYTMRTRIRSKTLTSFMLGRYSPYRNDLRAFYSARLNPYVSPYC